jgi:signal transduction histidine kinase/ActR/RegA family two-component response regulator
MANLLASPEERFFFKDREGRFLLVSDGMAAVFNTKRPDAAQLIGKTDADFSSPRHAATALAIEERVMATGLASVAALQHETYPDRRDEWAETSRLPLRDAAGHIVGTWGTTRDITAQVEAEMALASSREQLQATGVTLASALDVAVEASNAKSAFLANVSHEIRTPMNGVIGLMELLLETKLDDDQRALAVEVSRCGEQMVELITEILDLSRIEAGQMEIELTDFPLRETIDQACAVAGLQARAKGLEFKLAIADDVPAEARGDGGRLRQVVVNLVANAVKFTTEGRITVDVGISAPTSADAVVRIAVSDTGIGIDPAVLDHMFDPFTQADASTTRVYGGTGLGLAISRDLTELMGGTIGAESSAGTGTTFSIELPLLAASAATGQPSSTGPASVAASPSWGTTPRVLVVEDSPVNQVVATRTLERLGCRVDVVGDGREALEALTATRYDAVLMDCQMPRMDGYEATRELRRREEGQRHTPVIAMTAHVLDGATEACTQAGMDDYLSKPIQRDRLDATLRRWLPRHAGTTAAGDGLRLAS